MLMAVMTAVSIPSILPSLVPIYFGFFSCGCINPLGVLDPVASFFRRSRMGKKLYVGNLSYDVTGSDLEKMFQPHGTVESAQVIADRDTGRSKGFGFVEMGSSQEAEAATKALS